MAPERLKNSTLSRAFTDVLGDFADLFQKEMRLARAELSAKLSTKLRAGIWLSIAAVSGLITVILVAEALVVWITTFGITLHASCLIVAAVMGIASGLTYYMGQTDAQEELTPQRTLTQIKQDITTTKEQLT